MSDEEKQNAMKAVLTDRESGFAATFRHRTDPERGWVEINRFQDGPPEECQSPSLFAEERQERTSGTRVTPEPILTGERC